MSNDTPRDFSTSFTVPNDPGAVIQAIANVRAWWSEGITGSADAVGDKFTHTVLNIHRCDLVVQQIVPGKKVVWHVLDNHFSFTTDPTEWIGTDIVFDIARQDGQTQVTFTHVGLTPACECYPACHDGWSTYVQSLRYLIVTGHGQPNVGTAKTDSEKTLARRSGMPA